MMKIAISYRSFTVINIIAPITAVRKIFHVTLYRIRDVTYTHLDTAGRLG